jgi:hypothetical protein
LTRLKILALSTPRASRSTNLPSKTIKDCLEFFFSSTIYTNRIVSTSFISKPTFICIFQS